jgi:hypothetical protein
MRHVSFVRTVSSVERWLTNFLGSVLRTSMAVLTRLTGRGKHRPWRKRAEAELKRRREKLRS